MQCWSHVTRLDGGRCWNCGTGNCSGSGIHRAIEVVERITLEENGGRTFVAR